MEGDVGTKAARTDDPYGILFLDLGFVMGMTPRHFNFASLGPGAGILQISSALVYSPTWNNNWVQALI